jgi:photosystem I subunit 10
LNKDFTGLRPNAPFVKVQSKALYTPSRRQAKGALGAQCGYLGSATNLIMIGSTTALLVAGRFGLAPSSTRTATAGLKLVDQDPGLTTGDPAGFTIADVFASGALGHVIGVGIVLGLKATGGL